MFCYTCRPVPVWTYGCTSCIAIATWSHENYQIFIYATIVSKKNKNINITGPCMTYQQKKHTKQGNKNSESNIKQEILHIGTGIIVSSRHREGFNYTLAKRSMMQLSVTDVKGLYTSMLILEKILNSVSIFKLYLNSVGQC